MRGPQLINRGSVNLEGGNIMYKETKNNLRNLVTLNINVVKTEYKTRQEKLDFLDEVDSLYQEPVHNKYVGILSEGKELLGRISCSDEFLEEMETWEDKVNSFLRDLDRIADRSFAAANS